MMSKKQWSAMLCLHVSYLFLGASIFYHIENPLEVEKLALARRERNELRALIIQHYSPTHPEAQEDLFVKLTEYCGSTMMNVSESDEAIPVWDFYHSFFFSYTVVSTIGYGNLAPTTSFGRILMIFYGLFGIPINGILFANLGEFFGTTFKAIYEKYKSKNPSSGSNIDYQFRRFGLLGQIALYLLPGFLFFIFMPACLFVLFEGWDYALAVYYAFVTLTTIGFGDYVAGITDMGYGIYFTIYKIFLIFWITFGLGYLVMVIGFLTQGLKSKRVKMLEHLVAQNIKETQSKIWHGVTKDVGYLRKLLNEVYMMRFKPVYHDEVAPPRIHRSSSCPSFTLEREDKDQTPRTRRRANSEAFSPKFPELQRIQSETDLLAIDRNKTFSASAFIQPAELLAKVVDALGQTLQNENNNVYDEGVHGFSDEEILASERHGSIWSIGGGKLYAVPPKVPRGRAASEIRIPIPMDSQEKLYNNNQLTWTSADSNKLKILPERRFGKLSVPNVKLTLKSEPETAGSGQSKTLISRLNPFKSQPPKVTLSTDITDSKQDINKEMSPAEYLKKTARGRVSYAPTAEQRYINKSKKGRQSLASLPPEHDILEQTTVADLIRALTVLHSSADAPKRKMGTASFTPPKIPSTLNLLFPPGSESSQFDGRRRFSAIPAPLTPSSERRQSSTPTLPPGAARRRYSLHPAASGSPAFTPTMSPMVSRALGKQKRDFLTPPPPPYSAHTDELPNAGLLNRRRLPSNSTRRLSLLSTPSPRFRRRILPTSIIEGQATGSRTRHESLNEIKVEDYDDHSKNSE